MPLPALRLRIGAAQQHAPVGVLRERRPHLLAVDDEVIAVEDRRGAQRREIGARAGLGEAEAPEILGGQDAAREALLLLLACRRR